MPTLLGLCQGRETRRAELRPGDAHGVEGVDIEDVEAAASVHQHLGEALLADDVIDDVEQIAGGTGLQAAKLMD